LPWLFGPVAFATGGDAGRGTTTLALQLGFRTRRCRHFGYQRASISSDDASFNGRACGDVYRAGLPTLGVSWKQYLESDLILSAETEGLTWRGNHPEMTQDKNRRSKRPQERQEISLGFQWLGQIRLDADMLPEGLKDVALHPQVSSPRAYRRPAADETVLLCGRFVGTEVGLFLVR